MKTHSLNAVSFILYMISAASAVCHIAINFTSVVFSHGEKFITAFLVFAFGILAARMRCLGKDKSEAQRIFKATMLWLFIAYVFILIDFTLISNSFGRNMSNIFFLEGAQAVEYLRENTNFIPFATVKLFIQGFNNDVLSFAAIIENIVGNLLIFIPFAFFMPFVSRRINTALRFLFFVVLVVAVIEILQIVFLTGAADIDDLLLNVSGAILGYAFFNMRSIKKLLNRMCYGINFVV